MSWAAWRLSAADHRQFNPTLITVNGSGMRSLAEIAWCPGKTTLVTQVSCSETGGGIQVDFALGVFGSEGESAHELKGLTDSVASVLSLHGARHVVSVDPSEIVAGLGAPDPDPWAHEEWEPRQAAHIRQRTWTVGDDTVLIDVPSRFRLWPEPWAQVVELVESLNEVVSVRAVMFATEMSKAERIEVSDALSQVCSWYLRQESSPQMVRDATRARATLLNVWSSFGGLL